MKKLFLPLISSILCSFLITPVSFAQITYSYPLISSFQASQSEAPDLIQIPNNEGLTGEFVLRAVPESTCGQADTAQGYFFEDDAGLQFDNPEDFIGEAYSIAFNFQIDEFITPPGWVRIISFTHIDDVGVYIKLTDPPDYGTLEFWPNGTVGETDFFSTNDFYQMILVRNEEGLIKIIVNGSEFAEYDDSGTNNYVPQAPGNYIIWFRDHPSVLSGEASPGFISDIVITNYAWSNDRIIQHWEAFCSSLLKVDESVTITDLQMYPNPASDQVDISFNTSGSAAVELSISDLLGKEVFSRTYQPDNRIDHQLSVRLHAYPAGMYLLRLKAGNYITTRKLIIR
ncbi:MAG: hypothetical protein DRI88_06495 [Bacteroidetes bacterium]|nr:MAG: hypothetical protein DRI72_00205 [Bacteroidota bacterium]RLD47174.1 MAG: hypothetical protein DRI88_06495 [Bacteroidota bacterium]RLD70995.1 MAG: hypothetical protein DRI87_07535 [Bacteroidota bacterium]RLD87763.1 MAG: hypothetical protein DRJ02_05560 [Bacteroidota bacterium]